MTKMKLTDIVPINITNNKHNMSVSYVIDNLLSKPIESRIQHIEDTLEKIADRIAILDEPDKKRLAQFKELKKIYKKYKFVDALYGEKNNE